MQNAKAMQSKTYNWSRNLPSCLWHSHWKPLQQQQQELQNNSWKKTRIIFNFKIPDSSSTIESEAREKKISYGTSFSKISLEIKSSFFLISPRTYFRQKIQVPLFFVLTKLAFSNLPLFCFCWQTMKSVFKAIASSRSLQMALGSVFQVSYFCGVSDPSPQELGESSIQYQIEVEE